MYSGQEKEQIEAIFIKIVFVCVADASYQIFNLLNIAISVGMKKSSIS